MATTINAGTATSGAALSADTTGILQLQTGSTPTTAVTIDASQNVGIGTASPAQKLHVVGVAGNVAQFTGGTPLYVYSDTGNTSGIASGTNGLYFATSSNYVYVNTAGSERMRIDSSGNFLVGCTTAIPAANGFTVAGSGSSGTYFNVGHQTGVPSGNYFGAFYYNNAAIGSITQTGTTAVLYNTTSDYRLKTDVAPIQNALATVNALNPVSFTWVDGRPDDGFIAHELQAVIPNCVTGEKDAINEDGTPKYQQMDNSGVIPFLVKAIQELKAEVDALKGVK